ALRNLALHSRSKAASRRARHAARRRAGSARHLLPPPGGRPRRRRSAPPGRADPLVTLDVAAMPIYEYKCEDCGTRFEKLVRRSAEAGALECPSCGKSHLQQELSVFAAHANGGT